MGHHDYANPSALVDADWAQEHSAIRTSASSRSTSTRPPTSSHLRGAVGWNWTSQLADGVRRDIATKEDLGELLSQSGIGPDTTIVLYGDNNNWFAAWAYWQLKLFGLRDVRILNGGRKYWLDNGLPVTTDVPSYQPTGIQLGDPDFSLRAFRDDVLPRVGDSTSRSSTCAARPSSTARSSPRRHERDRPACRAIPGAASIPWAQTVREDGTFKSREELAALYEGKGITADKDIIAYCRIGERSSHSWFVLHELLGYQRVRNYDGSWTEYGSLVGADREPGGAAGRGGRRVLTRAHVARYRPRA